ncbi:Zinc finger CCCH domain-containing protein 17 [Acorus calamus]|uniref:Zinc finger CCCH domain-containing protein 17 n=1 Tax=Acorus calamus TaxID=4465 RepID=A0AAV9FFL6_ACOCL|nr:Zinc finger CCCH domain-containing protein 17 [Acorus calamus]
MDMESMERNGNKRIFQRLGGGHSSTSSYSRPKVCHFWLAGRCTKNPCPYLHSDPSDSSSTSMAAPPKRIHQNLTYRRNPNPNPNGHSSNWGRGQGGGVVGASRASLKEKVCNFWMAGKKCAYGEKCKYLHSWSVGDEISLLTRLEGHQKAITGIALPSGSDKLYSGSKDGSVRVWDCQSGLCAGVVNMGDEVGCLISEGPWVLVGIPNSIKVWNTQTVTEMSLSGPAGQVYAMAASNGMLFAGTQDGSILVWRFSPAGNCFEPAASLKGHSLAVVSLVVGANRLYSSSMDNAIKVWDLGTLQCIQTLTDHTSVVMSVLCWDQFLLSCSLDQTIKIWAATESGNLEVTYTHKEEHGLLSLSGMNDAQAKPVLLCSCNDNTIRLYDLPSFADRGKLISKEEVRALQLGPGGLFFSGDGTGELRVWRWSANTAEAPLA